ncbi:MAG: hypothetical protein AB1488_02770 [Nitrospirota bacterium]
MERRDQKTQDKMDYDISIIRTQMWIEDFQMRRQGMSLARLKGIKKPLTFMGVLI